ncbi:hypothetical protein L6R29_03050 [Myxococcota bacterium]|nr:hypothetical protein [Myxococcota bacterium]
MRVQASQIPDILRRAGILSSADLNRVFQEQQQWGGRLAPLLVEMGLVREDFLVKTLSRELRLPIATLDGMRQIDPDALRRVPVALCERYDLLPVGMERTRGLLQVAMSDPTEQHVLKEVHQAAGMDLQLFVGGVTAIRRAVRIYFYGESTAEVLRVVPDAFPDPSQASAYASGRAPSGVSFHEIPHTNAPRHPASYHSVPSLGAAPATVGTAAAHLSPRSPVPPPHYAQQPPSHNPPIQTHEDDWISGSSFLEEEVSGVPNASQRVDHDPHSYSGLPATFGPSRPLTTPTPHAHDAQWAALQEQINQLREQHKKEIHELQQAVRSRLQEQRTLIRGLLDLMVARGQLRREDLVQLLEEVSRTQQQGSR